MTAAFEIVSMDAGQAWRLVDADEAVVAIGPAPYRTADAALASARRFREQAATAALTVHDAPAAWALDVEGQEIGHAPASFATADAAREAAERVRQLAAAAPTPSARTPRGPFDPEALDRSVIALPLLTQIDARRPSDRHRVIIDLNLSYAGGRDVARARVVAMIEALAETLPASSGRWTGVHQRAAGVGAQYVVAMLSGEQIRRLALYDAEVGGDSVYAPSDVDPPYLFFEPGSDPTWEALTEAEREHRQSFEDALAQILNQRWSAVDFATGRAAAEKTRAIYRIWPDFEVRPLLTQSVRTVKADAARVTFAALGEGVVWAVVDSGVDAAHPHFARHQTLALDKPLYHRDFTPEQSAADEPAAPDEGDVVQQGDASALDDAFGHGTHVAGIIAGEHVPDPAERGLVAVIKERDNDGEKRYEAHPIGPVAGIAPRCKVLSLRVLDDDGRGYASDIIAALQYVQELNANGRFLRVHGVNLSVGYEFDPEWFACGHSPLCREVDLLSRSGVVVVVAAGNTGYGDAYTQEGTSKAGLDLSINDPGNAERAITVGATHRAEPHRYGVSYFSSKGPTGDGRAKPDLVAPGEKVLSCAAGSKKSTVLDAMTARAQREGTAEGAAEKPACDYLAESGTSMAAPHVSGAIAAFLSVRSEFIGRPDAVKDLFLETATDLGRDRYFQGHGLVDLLRAMQAV